MADYSFIFIFLLLATGLVAGIINTLAGGGSNLTLPALMLMGLPADVANATNRVGVLCQCLVGMRGFDRHGKLDKTDLKGILVPTLSGGLLGGLAAGLLPVSLLKPTLLLTMVGMALLILVRPSVVMAGPDEQPRKVGDSPRGWLGLAVAGFYGGFVQAGVGFVLIAALAGVLRYDLVRANALKLLCTASFTVVALAIFIWQGLVDWLPALILAVATMVGARLGVGLALQISQKTLKWFLFVMTLCASGAALWF